jgi:hypothetical protein
MISVEMNDANRRRCAEDVAYYKKQQHAEWVRRHAPRPWSRKENLHCLRSLVVEAVRYQREHQSTALHRFAAQRLTTQSPTEAKDLTESITRLAPGLPAPLTRILLEDIAIVFARNGPLEASSLLLELPLWTVR